VTGSIRRNRRRKAGYRRPDEDQQPVLSTEATAGIDEVLNR
jgi:hypothetical protein